MRISCVSTVSLLPYLRRYTASHYTRTRYTYEVRLSYLHNSSLETSRVPSKQKRHRREDADDDGARGDDDARGGRERGADTAVAAAARGSEQAPHRSIYQGRTY